MSNRGYLSGPHRLLPSYTSLATTRSVSNTPASPPEFSYNAFPRSASGGSVNRDGTTYTPAPPSPASSALNITYPNMNEFPYGLSGVQMPTYNFGSELYNYVSNGFPRKSRMCTFCNKVFTRSTTRRYHERRCPLLRASNSLAKSEENSAAAAAALKEQQRLKETANAISNPQQSALNTGTSNTLSSQMGSNLLTAPTSTSSPPPSLHPAYPSHFNPASALGSSPSRSAAAAYGYAHTYGSHFYNSISAAALASLDQNSNSLQSKKESDSKSWALSHSPSSKSRDHSSTSTILMGNISSKSFPPTSGVDLAARQCADFNIRSQLPVFPPSSLRDMPRSPSPEPGETRSRSPAVMDRQESMSPQDYIHRDRDWTSPDHDKTDYPNKISVAKIAVANLSGARLKTSSPLPILWNKKARLERAQEQYMQIQPLDDEDEDEDDEEEDEEVEEDEGQFNENYSEGDDSEKKEGKNFSDTISKSTSFDSLTCQFCKKSFSDTITRQAHEALHSQTKSFGCCLCSRAFHCAYSLRIHFMRHHNEGPYSCKQCSRSFDEIMDLKSHLLTQHSLTKQETCSLKYFSLLDNSNRLSNIPQSGVSDSEQDTREKNAQPQRRSADNLPSDLKDTDQETKNNGTNETDEQLANGDISNEETEVCKICNKTFAKSFIRFHERAHADQKPYECPICNKRFGYKNNMKSHMKLHQGLKPYQCQICGARFTRGSTLRRHGRRHKVSRNNMLDYVLYDQSATTARTASINSGMFPAGGASTTSTAATTHVAAAVTQAVDALASSKYNRTASVDHEQNSALGYLSHSRSSLQPTNPAIENEKFSPTAKRTPPRTSPMSTGSPRVSSNLLTNQNMTSPLVGGLAAVAAANLFAYPSSAPHLYQFYASANQLMPYATYSQSHPSPQAVQSDALNLSLGKRKSPYDDDEKIIKAQRKDHFSYDSKESFGENGNGIKIEIEEPGEMLKDRSPFAQNFSLRDRHIDSQYQEKDNMKLDPKEALKISTEDFAAQVNMCCPSPLVQSSTSSLQHHSSAGSPVGSSSCNDSNIQAHASPSGISHHSSPANSAPSPSNLSESHLQELLLSLLTSGKMFRCSFCDIYFTEYAMFRLHQKYHQCDVSRPFLCSVCGEDCKDKTYFTVHLSEHLGLSSKSGLA